MNQILSIAAILFLSAETPAPQFELQTASGKRIAGTVESLGRDGAAAMSGQPAVPGPEVLALRRVDALIPAWPRNAHMVLTNGDRIAGTPIELSGTFLNFAADIENPSGAPSTVGLRFPVTWISVLWLGAPASLDGAKRHAISSGSRASDEIVLRNGDIISGTLIGLDAKKGEVQVDLGSEKRMAPLDKIVVVAFNTRLSRVRKPAGPYGHLVLINGTRLTVLNPTIEKGMLAAQTIFKDPIRVPLSQVAALDIYQGKAVYLSDLKPSKYTYRTYQGEKFDWRADRNLAGDELQLQTRQGVQHFDKGLAMHGESALTFDLEGKYGRFECLVGLDARLGQRGSADVRVLVDGKERKTGEAKDLTLENGPRPVDLDVKGAKELTLVVNWGDGGNVGDFVDWCDARLLP